MDITVLTRNQILKTLEMLKFLGLKPRNFIMVGSWTVVEINFLISESLLPSSNLQADCFDIAVW